MTKNISFIVKLYNFPLSNYLPGFIRKIFLKKNQITFIPTKYKNLPIKNYPIKNTLKFQEDLIKSYKNEKSLSFNSYPNLKKILQEKFHSESNFNFLDYGGDKIDFYLDISQEFKNINYFLINQKKINVVFENLKNRYNYKNLHILNNLSDTKSFKYDFVFFGSSLQYLDDYQETLSIILPLIRKYVLFSATHFFTSEKYLDNIVVKQLNYLPKEYYLYFLNLNKFLNKLKTYDFKEIFNLENNNFPTNYSAFRNLKLNNISYRDIFFKK